LRYAAGIDAAAERALKTYDIELQRVKSMRQGGGLVETDIDALLLPNTTPDGKAPTTTLRMSEANARVLYALLKTQLAEFDRRKGLSQR
jgi:hypothetical protein